MVASLKIRSYTVKPSEPTPLVKMWLPEADQFQPMTHAPTVYIYPISHILTKTSVPPIQLLKDSLSQVLVHFYPLAGRLCEIGGGRLEIDCNAIGAELIEAESDSTIEDFGDFAPTPKLTQAFIPQFDSTKPRHEIPIMLIQLTKLKCGSLVLGTAVPHTIFDGVAAMHFFNSWAKISRGEPFEDDENPFLDRTILQMADTPITAPKFRHTEFEHQPFLVGRSDDLEERSKETTVAMLRLTKEQIEKLKKKANNDRTDNQDIVDDNGRRRGGRPYSRYEAISGHIWRCVCKARGHVNEQETALCVAVDCRNRLHPPLPPRYFGNVVFKSFPLAKSGDLLSRPLSYASSKIREGAELINDDYIRSSIDFIKSQPDLSKIRKGFHTVTCPQGDFLGNPNLTVTSWITLQTHCADFGWGKPTHMGPGCIGFDGKTFVLPGGGGGGGGGGDGDGDGDGSLVIALRLQVGHMDAFKRFIYEDIDHE